MKKLKEQALNMGKEGFKSGLHGAPALNEKFISWVIEETKSSDANSKNAFKKRCSLFKEYIRGWTNEMLAEPINYEFKMSND